MFLVSGSTHGGTQPHHDMDGIIHSDSEGDRGDDIGAEIELSAKRTHETKEDKERKNVWGHGNEPYPRRKKHGGHQDENYPCSQRQTIDLSANNVPSRAGQEDQVSRRMDGKFRREMPLGE